MSATEPHPSPDRTEVDLLTLAAIGTVCFVIQNMLHEGVGHGGACVLVGGDPIAVSTSYFDCDFDGVSSSARKVVAAAGSVINVLTGFFFLVLLRRMNTTSGATQLFLWLSGALGLLTGVGYLLFSGVIGVGDWAVIIEGFEPAFLWRVILTLVGAILYLACVAFLLAELAPMLDASRDDWLKIAFLVTLIPYLAGSTASTIGAILNPISPVLIFTSAASAFGGASALAWMTQMYKTGAGARLVDRAGATEEPLVIRRSIAWISAALILLAFHALVLGPSVAL